MTTNGPPYRVTWSPTALSDLNRLAGAMQSSRQRKELARAVRRFDGIIKGDPLLVGEPTRRTAAIEERVAIKGILAVNFAIDKKRRLVLVRRCQLMEGGGASSP